MLSRRTGVDQAANRFAAALEAARASGRLAADLADANPTRCGLAWDPVELGPLLADPRAVRHDPSPRGLPEARRAVSRYLESHGARVAPERILLACSTSEAYAFLWKLLCDPGDEVLGPAPSYPLLDLLAGLEGVSVGRYPLRYDGEWHLDRAALAAAVGPRCRAVVAVSPANPTGAVLSAGDLDFLEDLCARRGLALVGDEVFRDTAARPGPSVAAATRCLAFHLSGLSKVCGLPQLKVAWVAAAGPQELAAPALERLELLADTFLSVSAPAQLALPALLDRRERFLGPLRERLARNRSTLEAAARGAPFDPLASAGGWSAVLRIGSSLDEEELAIRLLGDGVAVHPGFFYDFERPGHLVVSLLEEPAAFAEGTRRLAARLSADPRV